ncbi:MAG: hypothetical protein ACSHWU_00060 [Marinicella sp.]
MRKQRIEQQVAEELTSYFEQARMAKCPPSMKQNLYEQIGINSSRNWFKPAMAFSMAAVLTLGLVWQNHNQNQLELLAAAERDMQIAMHYMQKVSEKTLEDANTHGIKPAIIVPVSKSMAQI